MRIHGTVGMIWSFLFRNTESSLICLYIYWQTNTLTQLVCSMMLIQSLYCPFLQKLMMPLFTEHCKGVANCALSSFPKVDAHIMFCAPETVRLPLGPACVLPWAATAPLRPLAPASTHALVPPGCILSRPCQGRGSIQTHWSSNRNPVVRRVLLWNLKLRICIGTCKTQYFW